MRRMQDCATFHLLTEAISSFSSVPGGRSGIPIGDDFIVVENGLVRLEHIQAETIRFLNKRLKLQVNPIRNKIIKTSHGLQILGVKIWPSGRVLNKRNQARIYQRLTHGNVSSYYGLIGKHGNSKQRKLFGWTVCAEILPSQ